VSPRGELRVAIRKETEGSAPSQHEDRFQSDIQQNAVFDHAALTRPPLSGGASGASEVRIGLAAGGKEIRTVGPAVRRSRSDAPYGYYSREPTGRPVSPMKPAHRG